MGHLTAFTVISLVFDQTYNFSLQFQDIIKWEGDEKRQVHELIGAFLVENQMLLNFFQ